MNNASQTQVGDLLKQTNVFGNLDEENIRILAGICYRKKALKKEILFYENDHGHSVYFCISGMIQLYKSDADGREIVIKLIRGGELFAEVILFETDKFPVNAIALQNSDLLVVPKNEFDDLLDDPRFRNGFIAMLMRKQRYLVEKIRYITASDVEERLFSFLKEHYGSRLEVTPGMTKKDVAMAIGTVPETLSRLLLRLKQEGLLDWSGKTLKMNPSWQGRSQGSHNFSE